MPFRNSDVFLVMFFSLLIPRFWGFVWVLFLKRAFDNGAFQKFDPQVKIEFQFKQ